MRDPHDDREFTDPARFRRARAWLWIRRLFFAGLVAANIAFCWLSLTSPFPWHTNMWGNWIFEPGWGLTLSVVALVIAWFMDVPKLKSNVTPHETPRGGFARRLARRRHGRASTRGRHSEQ